MINICISRFKIRISLYCVYEFRVIVSVNLDYFLKER
jgi:hypothetical protein